MLTSALLTLCFSRPRDVALVHGGEAGAMESEYKTFLEQLGGEVPDLARQISRWVSARHWS
jgi:hypothetical protein